MPAEKLNHQILSFSPFQLWIVPDQSMIFDCLEQIIHEETVLRRWPYFVVLSQGNRELAKPDCCLIDQHDERNNAVFLRTNKQTSRPNTTGRYMLISIILALIFWKSDCSTFGHIVPLPFQNSNRNILCLQWIVITWIFQRTLESDR